MEAASGSGAAWSNPKYKTVLCAYWEKGACKHGEGCQFAHGAEELQQSAEGAAMPVAVRRAKVLPCRYWDAGYCRHGSACQFAHAGPAGSGAGGGGGGYGGVAAGGGRSAGALRHPRQAQAPWGAGGGASAGWDMGGYGEEALQNPLYKTVICEFWEKGVCSKGPACPFAHGYEELRPLPPRHAPQPVPPPPPRQHYGQQQAQQGGGYGNYKTELCRYWEAGGCRNGPECTFAHGPEDLRPAAPGAAAADAAVPRGYGAPPPPPPRFQRAGAGAGAGPGGRGRPGRTVFVGGQRPYKSELCRYWQAGHCNSGAECQFAHGVEELRPHQPAAAAGGEAAVGGGLGRRGPGRRGRSRERGASSGGSGEGAANPRYKTELCRYWEQGSCKRGAACDFAHGHDDLRPAPNQHSLPLGAPAAAPAAPQDQLDPQQQAPAEGAAPASGGGTETYQAGLAAAITQLQGMGVGSSGAEGGTAELSSGGAVPAPAAPDAAQGGEAAGEQQAAQSAASGGSSTGGVLPEAPFAGMDGGQQGGSIRSMLVT